MVQSIRPKAPWLSVRDIAHIALFAGLLAICAWLTVPGPVPFTLQTFGVFAALGLLGGKRGTLAILTYLLLGAVGLPVFSGFQGGPGVLFGATGGYILGFLLTGLLYWLITALLGDRLWVQAAALVLGLLVCYAAGTFWFLAVYTRAHGDLSFYSALRKCVIPFLLPDAGKLILALLLTRRISAARRSQ